MESELFLEFDSFELVCFNSISSACQPVFSRIASYGNQKREEDLDNSRIKQDRLGWSILMRYFEDSGLALVIK